LCWPLLGQLFLLVEAERFVYTLRILITAGVPLLECLQYAQDSIKNTWLRQQLKDVRHHIERGDSFSIALKKKQIFMGLLTDLIAIGEQTGELEKGLVRAHHFLMQTLKRRLNTMMAFIEPLLILCLGSLLIWIAVAIFMPLYDHMEQTL
jgi:type II secretory pathway component PulF